MRIRTALQRGFTLIEVVMVILIISVLSVVVGKTLFQGVKSFVTSGDVANIDWQAYSALERLTNDIHNLRSASDISVMTANQLTFIDLSGNSIQYSVSGTSLIRNSQTLASGISAITFGYLTDTGVTTATASAVRYVSISVSLTQGSISSSFSTLVGTRGMVS